MKKIFLLVLVINLNLIAQINEEQWVNGFSKRVYGENLDYHSCHPEANLALLIRCYNDKDYIEWETDPVPSDYKNQSVTFVWIGGYSTATSTAPHVFHVYVNEKHFFEFRTSQQDLKQDWKVENPNGSVLNFRFAKIDQVDDFFGYMHLSIPLKELNKNRTVRIKVKGDATNSKDWYMTMQYPLIPKIRITPEKIITKDTSGKLMQRVRVSIDHFDSSQPVKISTEGKEVVSSQLYLGMNDFFVNYAASSKTVKKQIDIIINGKTTNHNVQIEPAKKITFYLIPHAHVDIGYTELQTEVEKKHWKNFDNAIKYSKQSSSFPSSSVFKWNVETLWAVKSYLENFPEKRKEFFEAVKIGWIGLDATYVDALTALCRPEELYQLVAYSNKLEKEIGVIIESAMISDIPGYTWGTVQAFADNGIKYFSVGPNEFDRIGNTLKVWGDKPFYWKSPSSEKKILVWVAAKGYSWFHRWRLTRDEISPLVKYIDELDAKNYPYDIVQVRYNIGGDNGFPDSTLADFVKQWNESHETPKFNIATNTEMFRDFENKYGKQIPTYSGDFTPYWEDGAGSTARETALNRNTAELLTQLETLYSISNQKNFHHKEFDEAWKYVLLFSEHTWGAWNSISDPELKSVKDQWEIKKSYALKADSIAQKLYNDFAFENIEKPFEHVTVWNNTSWKRNDVVTIKANIKTAGDFLVDETGRQISTQRLTTGELVFVINDIPPFGSKQFKFVKKDPAQISEYKNNLDDHAFKNSVLTNELSSFIDKSQYGLNEYIHTGRNAVDVKLSDAATISSKEKGPVINSVLYSSAPQGCNKLLREVRTFPSLKKIEIINTIDKKKIYDKENIRFVFPFNIENPKTRIDLAWSVIEPEKDQLKGANKNYFTVQRWIDVSNNKRGITLATVDAPLVELGAMNGEAWITPSGQEWFTKTSSSSKIFSWAMNNSWHTNYKAEQEGVTTLKYALMPHKEFDYLNAYRFGVEQSQPLLVSFFKEIETKNNFTSLLDNNTQIVITSIKKTGIDNYLVRFYNPTNKVSDTNINWRGKIFLSSGDEEKNNEVKNKLSLKPFDAVSLKFTK
jgi:hypothetical protein